MTHSVKLYLLIDLLSNYQQQIPLLLRHYNVPNIYALGDVLLERHAAQMPPSTLYVTPYTTPDKLRKTLKEHDITDISMPSYSDVDDLLIEYLKKDKVKSLELHNALSKEYLPVLSQLKNLEELTLRGYVGDLTKVIAKLPLKKVVIIHHYGTLTNLLHALKHVKELEIIDTPIGPSHDELCKLIARLESLELKGTNVTIAELADCIKNSKTLKYLTLHDSNFDVEDYDVIRDIVESSDLHGIELDNDAPHDILDVMKEKSKKKLQKIKKANV